MSNDENSSRTAQDAASVPTNRTDAHGEPSLVEDLTLVLFQPDSGTIAGEGTLFYALGGALLAELAETGGATVEDAGIRGPLVHAGATAPADELLRRAWEYLAAKPRGVQTLLAAVGPSLREPVLDRLVARGAIRRESRKLLGFLPSNVLRQGSDRRDELIARIRTALVDGAEPDPRTAMLIALVSASGALPTLHREIPWTTPVIARAQRFERGEWAAQAAAAAVARTMTAVVSNAIVAASVRPHD